MCYIPVPATCNNIITSEEKINEMMKLEERVRVVMSLRSKNQLKKWLGMIFNGMRVFNF